MAIKLFGYKNCSSCRKAEKHLTELNIDFDFIDITQAPPTEKQLEGFFNITKLPLKKWFNTSGGLYREMGLKDRIDTITAAQAIPLLASHGKLIKRPIVVSPDLNHPDHITLGYQADTFDQIWGPYG